MKQRIGLKIWVRGQKHSQHRGLRDVHHSRPILKHPFEVYRKLTADMFIVIIGTVSCYMTPSKTAFTMVDIMSFRAVVDNVALCMA